jgi:hypothetical protein
MKQLGMRGAVRGKATKTTISDTSAPCPRDKVNRVFQAPAPNLPWLSDFTYVSRGQGFVYVAFVLDAFTDCIVGPLSAMETSPVGQWDGSRGRQKQTLSSPFEHCCATPCRAAGRAIFVHSLHWAFGRGRH